LIEAYKQDIAKGSTLKNTPASIVSNTSVTLQQQIDSIITKFDDYEYYLYFTSASTAWPKENSTQPYSLYSVTSSQVYDWLGGIETVPTAGKMSMLYSASLYDNLNKDNIQYTTPSYIKEDGNNQPYLTFLNMIGQHFDNIWLYYKDVSTRYSAENNPHIGISIDMVADALRGFGMQLYTNTNVSDNIYYSLFGINDTGSLLQLSSSLFARGDLETSAFYPPNGFNWLEQSVYLPPIGNEKINKYVTTAVRPTVYAGVTIGNQTWMANNLGVTTYRNGDPIPQVTDPTEWANLTTGAWCYYSNVQGNGEVYGKLYNWYAVNDPRGLAPKGWHVPSDAEFTALETALGGTTIAGGRINKLDSYIGKVQMLGHQIVADLQPFQVAFVLVMLEYSLRYRRVQHFGALRNLTVYLLGFTLVIIMLLILVKSQLEKLMDFQFAA